MEYLNSELVKNKNVKVVGYWLWSLVAILLVGLLLSSNCFAATNIESGFKDAQDWAIKIGGAILGLMIIVVGIFFSVGSNSASKKLADWVMGAFFIAAGGGLATALVGFWK